MISPRTVPPACTSRFGGGFDGKAHDMTTRKRIPVLPALAALMGVMGGCHQPQRPIFPEHDPPLVWPDPPNPPRIRYVGALRGAADLKPSRRGFAAIRDALLGAKKPETLYGPRGVVCTPDGTPPCLAHPPRPCSPLS